MWPSIFASFSQKIINSRIFPFRSLESALGFANHVPRVTLEKIQNYNKLVSVLDTLTLSSILSIIPPLVKRDFSSTKSSTKAQATTISTETNSPSPSPSPSANITKESSDYPKSQLKNPEKIRKYRPTKLPIVLCHGLFGYDKLGPEALPLLQLRYWGGIHDVLAEHGAKVYIARVPATGNIEERATHLKSFLEDKLAGQDVNLVAHSMGGLDARFLISHMAQSSFTIRSLTTVSTPHRGSPVMDWFRDNIGVGKENLEYIDSKNTYLAKILSKLIFSLDAPAYQNLTTEYLTQIFNPSTPDNPNVQYYSYGASTQTSQFSPMRLTHDIVRQREGENDGVVSVYSSRWGEFIGVVNADHFELTRKQRRSSFPYSQENFPLGNFIRLQHLWTLATSIEPLLKSLPIPSLRLDKNTNTQDSYKDRLKSICDRMHGPSSLDDFIYGYDDEYMMGSKPADTNKEMKFDSFDFYLSIMDKLSRHGF